MIAEHSLWERGVAGAAPAFPIWKVGRKAIASDLKSDDRKVMWVRILHLPYCTYGVIRSRAGLRNLFREEWGCKSL